MDKLLTRKIRQFIALAIIGGGISALYSTSGFAKIVFKQASSAGNEVPVTDNTAQPTSNIPQVMQEDDDEEDEGEDNFAVLTAAYRDYNQKNYTSAYNIFSFHAKRNNPQSMLATGYLLGIGYGTTANYEEAKKYLQKVADLGYPRAYYLLGLLELHKAGSGRFNLPAERLLNKAADLGDAPAANALANQYYQRRLFDKASYWNNKAIQLGSQAAQKNQKIINSGSQDLAKATSTSLKSEYLRDLHTKSKNGDGQASYELARRYHKGSEIGVNFGEAIRLYRLAADQGNEQAKRILPILLSKQNPQGNLNTIWLQETANLVPTPPIILPTDKSNSNQTDFITNKFNLVEDNPLDNLLFMIPVPTNKTNSGK